MMPFAQQAAPPPLNFWNAPHGSTLLWIKIGIALLLGIVLMIALLRMSSRWRRPVVAFFTFIAGGFWMISFLWPKAQDPANPKGFTDNVSVALTDTTPVVTNIANSLTAVLLGLGAYSIISIHGRRFFKMQKDWFFSMILLISMVLMLVYGYLDWIVRRGPQAAEADLNPFFVNRARDLLFDGMQQTMEAAMFSLIAFFILSAAYRAFRIRSIESTILLATALIVMLSLMGAIVQGWQTGVEALPFYEGNKALWDNLKLQNIYEFIFNNLQTPAIRAVNFGVGIGALAMGMRLWLSLEKGGVTAQ